VARRGDLVGGRPPHGQECFSFTIATEDAEDTEKGRVAIVENDRQLRADFAQVIHGNNFGGFYFGSIIDALRKGRRDDKPY